ncbi:SEC-C domain-containing protein [Runella slithyformis]|uniref:SEC-C domain-containing protein n=1 Tax=Runella slithyformis TaxID=106 RepID=UPI00031E8697|nr:SEC-C domain-containing protein [Runella slithyformis]
MDKLKKDIALTLEQYPKLELVEYEGKFPCLKGRIDIVNEGEVLEKFDVIIQYTEDFPYVYPKAYEVSGRFPIGDSGLHINYDGTLCLNVEQDESIQARNGISTLDFIKKVLIPNLAWRICRLEELTSDLQEHRHGVQGIIDSYAEKLRTSDVRKILILIGHAAINDLPDRNDICLCGSEKKYKLCHYTAIESIKLIKRDVLIKHFRDIKETLDE